MHQYACFNAEYYKTPRGFCSHTYPSLKFPEDQQALWDGLVNDAVSTLATDEYPTNLELKLKGKTIEDVTGGNLGAEARMGIAWTEGVGKRGMTLRRFADITATNAARILGLYPRKGVIAPGSDADIVPHRPDDPEDPHQGRLPRLRLQPLGGLAHHRLARPHAPARQDHRRAWKVARLHLRRPLADRKIDNAVLARPAV